MSLPAPFAPSSRARAPFARAVLLVAGAALAAASCGGRRGGAPARPHPLLNPDARAVAAAAPDTFWVRLETTKGPFTVQVVRAWAPRGADRLYYLTRSGFYDGARFFRVLPGFVAQFGASGDPRVSRVWDVRTFADDPVRRANMRGTVSFATAGANTRTTQLFVNLRDNVRLDRLGFAPVGRVVEGMAVVDSLYGGYGEGAPKGRGPDQDRIATEGTRYLERSFPRLDWVRRATVVREGRRRR
jgi:peptidyl-prolyl cis-trans isomerase A (cyclophilin A)